MIVKIISLFLIGMLVLAMFGRLKFPGASKVASMKCPKCGALRRKNSKCRCEAE